MKKLYILAVILTSFNSGVARAENMPQQRDTIQVGDSSDAAFQSDIHQRFRDIFNSFFDHAFDQADPLQNTGFMPIRSVGTISARADMNETNENIILTVDMPGAKKENIDVQIAPRVRAISYQQKEESRKKDDASSIREARYASFSRQYTLPDYAVVDKADAEYKDGVLTITIPKDEKLVVKPRKLEIK